MKVHCVSEWAASGLLLLLVAACGGGREDVAGRSIPALSAMNAAALPTQASSAAVAALTRRPVHCEKAPFSDLTRARGKCLTGTAATGSALANATVSITDSAGQPACQEPVIATDALGQFSCTLQIGEVAPFFVVVTDPTGNASTQVSVATTTPHSGTALTVNATPLTTGILAALSPDGNPLTLVASGSIDTTALQELTAAVLTQLAPVLSALGAPANYDPFTTAITAATASNTGNTADQLLDVVQVVSDPTTGVTSLTTIGSTDLVPLGSTQPVQSPPAGVTDLAQAQQAFAAQLTSCFALPKSSRVLATNTSVPASEGGRTVTSAAPECAALGASTTNGAGTNFLQNGFLFGQFFYNLLNSNAMTGATFSVPEIMLFNAGDPNATPPTGDTASLNFRYVSTAGNPGNFIVQATNLTAAPTPGWWITGNGAPVDVNLRPIIRQVIEVKPNTPGSHFQSGLSTTINAVGPGSIVNGQSMSFARIKGPGLPLAGLVFVAPIATEVGQTYMDISNVTGTIPPSGRCGSVLQNCPNFWLQISVGVSGPAATQLATNQNTLTWLQPSTPVEAGSLTKGQAYTIEVFYGANTTPTYIFTKRLVASMVQATQASGMYWNTLGPNSTALLDPANTTYNGALNFPLTLDWVQNPLAEQIGSATISINYAGSLATSVAAPAGATSITIPIPNTPPLTTSTSRQLSFGYRMLDGSNKSMIYRYN